MEKSLVIKAAARLGIKIIDTNPYGFIVDKHSFRYIDFRYTYDGWEINTVPTYINDYKQYLKSLKFELDLVRGIINKLGDNDDNNRNRSRLKRRHR
tara:strand:+ start:443 stop:730 length:288 start_codon:yes stop_codon:yes gene_type:complete